MRKKWIVLLVCVLLVVGIGILLWGWYYKGYPTTASVAAISPLPAEVSMELTEVTNTGGVLVCQVDTTEYIYYFHHVLNVDGSNLSVEKQSEDGQWLNWRRGNFRCHGQPLAPIILPLEKTSFRSIGVERTDRWTKGIIGWSSIFALKMK